MSSKKFHKIRPFFDTNVLISSFLTDGLSKELLIRAKIWEFIALVCPFILREFREKLKKKFQIKPPFIKEALELINSACTLVLQEDFKLPEKIYLIDQADINILLCALSGYADFIVTGDKELLEMKTFRGIEIITPRGFINFLEKLS
ncbi:MAG: putative toxin-antitoxin system toxin component, PIN family [Thermodesulfobacteriota bacterium]